MLGGSPVSAGVCASAGFSFLTAGLRQGEPLNFNFQLTLGRALIESVYRVYEYHYFSKMKSIINLVRKENISEDHLKDPEVKLLALLKIELFAEKTLRIERSRSQFHSDFTSAVDEALDIRKGKEGGIGVNGFQAFGAMLGRIKRAKFLHSHRYHWVSINGEDFCLDAEPAKIVKILHKAHLRTPGAWLSLKEVAASLFPNGKERDISKFRLEDKFRDVSAQKSRNKSRQYRPEYYRLIEKRSSPGKPTYYRLRLLTSRNSR